MPVPSGGARALYELDADEYFVNHDAAERDTLAIKLVQEAAALAGRKGRLLDIGSGRGEVLKAASAQGWDVLGLEPSPTFAKAARAHAPGVEIREDELNRANLPAERFDVVILQAVLEHLHNPIDVIREVARVLAPGGVFYADVPNEVSLYAKLGNAYQRIRGRDWVVNLSPTFSPFHVFGYSVRSLRALYRRHGLEPVRFVIGGGRSSLGRRAGAAGWVEYVGARAVADAANASGMGTYIASWARKAG